MAVLTSNCLYFSRCEELPRKHEAGILSHKRLQENIEAELQVYLNRLT